MSSRLVFCHSLIPSVSDNEFRADLGIPVSDHLVDWFLFTLIPSVSDNEFRADKGIPSV